jgi:hypothetical protein
MPCDQFFEAIFAAGAILSGFCGTFLVFRIQREANYYRQPVLDFRLKAARSVDIKRQQFSSAFLLLILASLFSVVFGFVIPLLALAGSAWAMEQTKWVVGGLLAALILLAAYFFDELVHYHIFRKKKIARVCERSERLCQALNIKRDDREWREEMWIVLPALILAGVVPPVVVCVVF